MVLKGMLINVKATSAQSGTTLLLYSMQRNRNTVTLVLMSSSILLLVILQVFWLRSSYEKAFYDFRREGGMIFRTTVHALRDSIFMTNVEQLSGDSVEQIITRRASLRPAGQRIQIEGDSVKQFIDVHEEVTKVQIYMSDSSDVLREDFVGPLSAKIQTLQFEKTPGAKKSFVIRVGPDSLNIDTLSRRFEHALNKADIQVPFDISHDLMKERFDDMIPGKMIGRHLPPEQATNTDANIFSDTIRCEPVPLNPFHRYQASLTGVRGVLFREISPQILFSLFLTLVTTASFIFMYRNIRAQQRLMESKNEFISNVTHELKTPVATVSVALEALKNFSAIQNPRLTEEYLDIARRELDRLSAMTDKILGASIFESRGVEFEPEEVDIDVVTRQMLTSMKVVFEKRGAIVNFQNNSPGSDYKISGSALHLTNVLYNLVDNALKYSVESPRIDITLQENHGKIVLTVKDNGVGIAPAFQQKIFEKFFRVPSGDVHNTKGYGLGLSYVASVIKSHRGVIDVQSQEGKGSTFIITLPRIPGKAFRAAIPVPSLGKSNS